MGILTWIIVGLIAGWLAGLMLGGGGVGILGDIVVGIIGALIGGFVASALFGIQNPINDISLTGVFVAFVGAVLLITLIRTVAGRKRVI